MNVKCSNSETVLEQDLINVSNSSSNYLSTYYDLNGDSGVQDSVLHKAGRDLLNNYCSQLLKSEDINCEDSVNLNTRLSDYVLKNTKQLDDGRLEMPIIWNSKVSHNLGTNYSLAVQILNSNYRKLHKNPEYLTMTDNVFREQESLEIIEKIPDLKQFQIENPSHSFLPHMSVIKPDEDTTKYRVVYLSNLCQKDKGKARTISHNEAIFSGPNLNNKLTTSLLLLRFDVNLLIFDIKKAFLNIA
jgi:hypothetical protein